MPFSPEDQQRLVPLWQDHITPALGPKAARQFTDATLDPQKLAC